ncbi:DNA-processing protein DprA [Oribacterium sp. C9]|uniref:DNA-processing protein DprA n=1 Tax=Oribacterium sp. C9 TaxID=1943579 RepID=UPI001FA873E9|nr:DNA-processing protein DprA [Oribacterium sp. C9]
MTIQDISLRKEIRELTPLHEDYPERLRMIPNPPSTLYVRGKLPPDNVPTVAIIGSREATPYGTEVAETFGRMLAEKGIGIISGMAAGADSAGQWGAIKGGGKTYAVLGCGLNICYPARNYRLYDEILRNDGGLISEVPLDSPPLARQFASRNRIISALSDAVIVIEARERSGTFITVNAALDQGKQVFAVPGRLNDPLSKGCLQLIKDGAEILTSPEDILEFLHLKENGEQLMMEKDSSMLTPGQKSVLQSLESDALHLDVLTKKTGLPVQELTAMLLELEILGFAECTKTGFYRRKSY